MRIDDVIAPYTWEQFTDDFREHRPAHLKIPNRTFSGLITPQQAFALVRSSERNGDLWVVKDGTNRTPQVFDSEGAANVALAGAAYRSGCTLVLNRIHRRIDAIARLCRNIEVETCARSGANLYVTPPNSRGHRVHFDGHDVFILQVWGSKYWRVYEPITMLPLESFAVPEAYRPRLVLDCRLGMGDVLYIPRGFLHEPWTTDDPSGHLTVRQAGITAIDLLVDILRNHAYSDVRFRRTFAIRHTPDNVTALCALLGDIAGKCGSVSEVSAAFERARESFVRDLPPLIDEADSRLEPHTITPESLLRKRDGAAPFLRKLNGHGISLVFSGGRVNVEESMEDAADFVLERESFRVREMPLEPADAKVALAARLMKAGLLVLCDARSSH